LIVPQAPVPATRLPRSALTFSSRGDLAVRTVDADGTRGGRSNRKQIMNDRPLGLMERRLRRGQTVT
jgi:hypothetical protein